jgi:hypothetical protein
MRVVTVRVPSCAEMMTRVSSSEIQCKQMAFMDESCHKEN